MGKPTFIDLFAGIGGFRLGLEQAGTQCLGHCEIDKYANASYINMHKPNKKEWYADDIKRVTAKSIPKADIWTAGFPCQDISQAGKRRGLAGNRSGLFYAVTDLIGKTTEENKPRWLIFENVRGLFSVNRGLDFYKILLEMDECGYDAEWQIINSATYVPQSRNRIFIIGHLRGRDNGKVFPVRTTNTKTLKKLIGGGQGDRVYAPSGTSTTLTSAGGGGGAKTGLYAFIDKSVSPKLTNHSRTLNIGTVSQHNLKIRRLTPRECFRLQGFPDKYFDLALEGVLKLTSKPDAQLYKMAGNSVTVPVIVAIGANLIKLWEKNSEPDGN